VRVFICDCGKVQAGCVAWSWFRQSGVISSTCQPLGRPLYSYKGKGHMTDKYLSIDEILTILKGTPPRLAKLTAGLDSAQLHNTAHVGEWSVSEVLAHLRACDEVWGGYYIMTILTQNNPTIKAINPRTWIKNTNYLEQKFQPSLRAFTKQRKKLLAKLEPLPAKDWTRTNTLIGAGKPLQQTLLSHADGLARHERAHLKQIERTINALQAA
jgi:hypothetical protein